VDMVQNGSIIRTPFKVFKETPTKARAWDAEDEKWVNATISFDGVKLTAVDNDGLDWEVDPEDLLDEGQWHFL